MTGRAMKKLRRLTSEIKRSNQRNKLQHRIFTIVAQPAHNL